ncbi:unnamed protein product [Closterium sp. NIES-64]|nr:unnamed protein product [Closterium sp. NIES-64]
MISNNSLYGPLPDCLFDNCITQIDVSGNSLYGRINRDFKNMLTTNGAPIRTLADHNALVNLAHNFFFGDGVIFAAGCKVCPTEVSEPNNLGFEINNPNNLGTRDTFPWRELGGKCGIFALGNLVDERGKTARVSLSGNCLTLTPNKKCSSNATQRSTAACQAFCSITDNGPCDGHGACVPAAPASPSNFTCLCDAGYTTVDSSNGSSTCDIVHSTTNTTTGNPCFMLTAPHFIPIVVSVDGCNSGHCSGQLCWLLPVGFCGRMAVVAGQSEPLKPFTSIPSPPLLHHFPGFLPDSPPLPIFSLHCPHARLSTALMLASPLPSCSPLHCPHARLSTALMLPSPLPSCSPLHCPHAPLSTALMLPSPLPSCSLLHCPHARLPLPSCSPLHCPHAPLSTALMLPSPLPSCSLLHCPHARLPLPSCSPLLCPHARLSSALMLASPLPSCSPLLCPHARLCSALMLCPRIYTLRLSHLWSDFFLCTEKWEGLDVCEQFSLQQMLTATNNWSEDNVLGKGGFGIVYKGRSPQGQLWAIKRSTIMTNDFETEVRAMASLHHVHLVRLLGFCLDQNVETGKQEQILVYEFMANRDLEYHIHRTKNPLSLRQRLRLAQGAAEGLAYLHGFDTPIVHRDIKPANILVSADMQAKVADFGLLKRLTHGDADATRVAGTPGYVDPDYNRTSVITAKSDVFSFGIVLLELLTPFLLNMQLSTASLIITLPCGHALQAMKLLQAYELEELRDRKMPAASEEAIVDFADLALDCIKSPGTRRPTMKDVAYRLSALIAKHCPDEEDEWENVVTEEGASNQGMPSELCGDGGREPERSHGSQSGVYSQSMRAYEQVPLSAPGHPFPLFRAPARLCAASPQHPPAACFPSASPLPPAAPLASPAAPTHCWNHYLLPGPHPPLLPCYGTVAWVETLQLPIQHLVSQTHPSAPSAPAAHVPAFPAVCLCGIVAWEEVQLLVM